MITRGVLVRRPLRLVRSRAGLVVLQRGVLIQRFMGAHGVIALPPGIEGSLASRVIGERAPAQQFGFEGAVKALVLALGLGVIGP